MGRMKPLSAPPERQAGASAPHQEPPQLRLRLPQPPLETRGGLLRGERPGSGYNEPARSLRKPRTYHLPVAFLDVLILQGFVQVEAGRKNRNNQVKEEPRVSHLIPKPRALQVETWQRAED